MKTGYTMAKLAAGTAAVLLLAACGTTKSETVVELTKSDKHMDCTQLQLEITEAEFFRQKAERNRGLSLKNVVMPLGYPSTYLSANKAVDAATGRVAYLTKLYEVKGCGSQQMAGGYDAMGYGGYDQQGGGHAGVAYQQPQYQQQPPQYQQRPAQPYAY